MGCAHVTMTICALHHVQWPMTVKRPAALRGVRHLRQACVQVLPVLVIELAVGGHPCGWPIGIRLRNHALNLRVADSRRSLHQPHQQMRLALT